MKKKKMETMRMVNVGNVVDEALKIMTDDLEHEKNMIAKVIAEYVRASKLHKPFNSPHEGYGVIKEEFDEMWKCIMENEIDHSRREAMQLCAMSLRYLIDIKPDPKSP